MLAGGLYQDVPGWKASPQNDILNPSSFTCEVLCTEFGIKITVHLDGLKLALFFVIGR